MQLLQILWKVSSRFGKENRPKGLKEHLNQPMKWKYLYTGIMISKIFAEYRNRPMKPTTLNKKLAIYGVQAVLGRDKKRVKDGKANENRDVLFWFLVEF